MSDTIAAIYSILQRHFGSNPAWWPIFGDDAPFEMLLGAVLAWMLGAPLLLYLAGAGVGHLIVVDDDRATAASSEQRGEVHRGRGLPDAALRAGDGVDPTERVLLSILGHGGSPGDRVR